MFGTIAAAEDEQEIIQISWPPWQYEALANVVGPDPRHGAFPGEANLDLRRFHSNDPRALEHVVPWSACIDQISGLNAKPECFDRRPRAMVCKRTQIY